jgi:hypothetical protein
VKFSAIACGLLIALSHNVRAHAPFDGSARAILHLDFAEVTITTGRDLGERYLTIAQIDPHGLSAGHPRALSPDMATNFFTVAAGEKFLTPREVDVITDGVEFQFHFEYPLAPSKSLALRARFIPALKPPRAAPLVLTDENGNILGSAVLTEDKSAAEFPLPEQFVPTNSITATASVALTNPPSPKPAVAVEERRPRPAFVEFLKLGIGHILNVGAFDHLLFLTALLLGCRKLKPMLLVITCFTLAHSITLALAALDVVTISTRIVEPLIAASIIFVAAENFRRKEKSWHRYALTCGFGLIHGFGFASALRASGLGGNGSEIAMPLLAFNLGVEIGQLVVAATMLPALLILNKWPWFTRHGTRVISALVILVAAFWLWQRLS